MTLLGPFLFDNIDFGDIDFDNLRHGPAMFEDDIPQAEFIKYNMGRDEYEGGMLRRELYVVWNDFLKARGNMNELGREEFENLFETVLVEYFRRVAKRNNYVRTEDGVQTRQQMNGSVEFLFDAHTVNGEKQVATIKTGNTQINYARPVNIEVVSYENYPMPWANVSQGDIVEVAGTLWQCVEKSKSGACKWEKLIDD